jgi:hypothetical protein
MELTDLPVPVKNLNTAKRLPASLRGTIYEVMLESVSEELSVWRDAVRLQKTSLYDIDLMGLDRLIEIAGVFEVPFVVSVKDDIYFLREEVRSIPFKIYYKGTPTLYKSFFYAVDRYGEMFIYEYRADLNSIAKLTLLPFDEAVLTPPDLPFRQRSYDDFSGNIKDLSTLDSGLYLDTEDALLTLDISSAKITTNHIGLEYFIDRIILRKDIDSATGIETINEYLMTNEYLDYISQSVEFARRVKEVPHIGSQLSIQVDTSGLCNSYNSSSEYSVPSLKLKAVARPDFFDLVTSSVDITYVEFGMGKQDVASVQDPSVPFPSELAAKVCSIPVPFQYQFKDTLYAGAIGRYSGRFLNEFLILNGPAFDGAAQEFDFSLPFAPVQRGNITLKFRLPSGDTLFVNDDYKGIFISLNGYGTIDYKTGACHLSTKFDYPQVDNMETATLPGDPDPTEGRTRFTRILQGGSSVVPGSLRLVFAVGNELTQRTYTITDDGEGNFTHPLIQSGIVNYATKSVDITFTTPLVDPGIKPFSCKYSFPVDFKLPSGTELLVSYLFTRQSVYITEAGFRSKDGDLLNYATFPPFEFNSTAYHLDFMILVKKPTTAS